jgi:hypothetical protein
MSAAAALFNPPSRLTAEQVDRRCRELKLLARGQDLLVIARPDGPWVGAEGVLKAIGDDKVTFAWKDVDRRMDRKLVPVVRLAQVAAGPTTRPTGTVVLTGGSRVGFTRFGMDAKVARIDTPLLGKLELPRKVIAAVRLAEGELMDLAKVKPDTVSQHGYFGPGFAYRVGRNVAGGPIRLGGRTYDEGLGLHSFCELIWRIDGKFSRFVAIAGIDDAVRPAGDATLTVLGDGKPLAEPFALTGRTDPVAIRLSVKSVKELTIRVEFGADDLGVADHVDLASPRLIK